jgi:hypothetical protein
MWCHYMSPLSLSCWTMLGTWSWTDQPSHKDPYSPGESDHSSHLRQLAESTVWGFQGLGHIKYPRVLQQRPIYTLISLIKHWELFSSASMPCLKDLLMVMFNVGLYVWSNFLIYKERLAHGFIMSTCLPLHVMFVPPNNFWTSRTTFYILKLQT